MGFGIWDLGFRVRVVGIGLWFLAWDCGSLITILFSFDDVIGRKIFLRYSALMREVCAQEVQSLSCWSDTTYSINLRFSFWMVHANISTGLWRAVAILLVCVLFRFVASP